MIIIFGLRRSRIATYQVKQPQCPSCNHETQYTVNVYGRYFHIFFIPIFPVGKKTHARCNHCGAEFNNIQYVPNIYPAYLQATLVQKPRRPFWHYLGFIFVAAMLGFSIISAIVAGSKPEDPRHKLFSADKDKLTSHPRWEDDSVACMIQSCMDDALPRDLDKGNYEYYTSQKDDKLLVIVKMHDLKKIKKEDRKVLLYRVDDCIQQDSALSTRKIYIAIEGKWNLLMTKTPDGEDVSQYASGSALYGFYE